MIKANVKYTGDHMWASHKATSSFDWKFVTDIILYSALGVMGVVILGYLMPFFGKAEWVTKYTLIFLVSLAFDIYIVVSTLLKKIKKNKKIKTNVPDDSVHNISFGDEEFLHEYKSDDEWGVRRCGYDTFHSATETKRFFLVRTDKSKICVIGKHELTQGTPEELSQLLTEKLGKKFRRKCR